MMLGFLVDLCLRCCFCRWRKIGVGVKGCNDRKSTDSDDRDSDDDLIW